MERKNSDIETNANVEMEETYSMSNATTDVDAYMDVDDASTHNMTAAAAQLTYNAVSTFAPFIPYVDSIFAVIEEIIKIYDNVEYNKKTCRILVDRVETVNMVIRKLVRRKDEEKLFCNQDYYHAFIRLDQTLKIIKRFVRDVSQYKNFRKVLFAKNIQEECQDLIRKLETACDDLKFGIIISLEEKQREQAILKEDFENMINMMDSWDEKLNLITAQISEMKNTDHKLKVDIIEPTRLSGRTTMTRGKIIKKVLDQFIQVACKPVNIEKDERYANKFRNNLAILGKLHASSKIVRFHGLSIFNGIHHMIFEWAEEGNLRNYYETQYISPEKKLQFATNISEGLGFLQVCGIYHHDVRCENILITREDNVHTTAKLANFNFSREINQGSIEINDISELVRWMAPEKLIRGGKPRNYTYPCEVFSFGMLLWELLFQKLPYEKMKMEEICSHIKDGKREDLNFHRTLAPSSILTCFQSIIVKSWQQDPDDRPTIIEIYSQLKSLLSAQSPLTSLGNDYMQPHFEAPDSCRPSKNYFRENFVTNDPMSIEIIIPLEEGLRLHKESRGKNDKYREKAWRCFEKHASLGDPLAIYWKGHYKHEGYYVEKDTNEATELFKEAADNGVADAQLRYAFSLLELNDPRDYPEVMSYLTKAAMQENATALYHMGDIHYNGKLGREQDEKKGLEYLKLAAIKKHPKAIEFFENKGMEFLE